MELLTPIPPPMMDELLRKPRKKPGEFVSAVCTSTAARFIEVSLTSGGIEVDDLMERIFHLYVSLLRGYDERAEAELGVLLSVMPESRKQQARNLILRIPRTPMTSRIYVLTNRIFRA